MAKLWDMVLSISSSVIIPAIVALIVAVSSHLFTAHRERQAKRRELTLSYLVKSYRTLSKAVGHPKIYEMNDDLQEAIVDIQFLGSATQASMAVKIAQELAENETAEISPLLHSLRQHLRKELGLDAANEDLWWGRINPSRSEKLFREIGEDV